MEEYWAARDYLSLNSPIHDDTATAEDFITSGSLLKLIEDKMAV